MPAPWHLLAYARQHIHTIETAVKCKCIVPHAYEIRIERAWWMRMLPFSAAYYCTHCQVKSLQFGRHRLRDSGGAPASRH